MTTAKCPSCAAERVDVKGRGNAACAACNAAFNSLPTAFATLKRAGVDGAKLQQILGAEGKKLHKCVSCTEMFTTFPVLGDTLHACVPCQAVWLASGAMERFHRAAVAGKANAPVSTATMQMAVANISPPSPSAAIAPSPPPAPPAMAPPPAPAAMVPPPPMAPPPMAPPPMAPPPMAPPPMAPPPMAPPPMAPPPMAPVERPAARSEEAIPPPGPPPPAPPPLAPPPLGAPPPAMTMGGFGPSPSTLMMASAAPGSSVPSAVARPERAIDASIDPPSGSFPVPQPPMLQGLDPVLPPSAKSDPSGKGPASPGSSSGMKPPPTSKPFNLTNGTSSTPPADVAAAADAKASKTGETKKPDKSGDHKKPDKKPGEKKLEKGEKKPAPTLFVEESGGSTGMRAAALLGVILVGAFVAWQFLGGDSLARVGGGKGARFGQDELVKESIKVGERLASKVTAERPGGDLVVWYFPNADAARGHTAMLIEVLGEAVHFQPPRDYDEMTILNGEVRQGDKTGRVRAFFKGDEAWVLVAMSKAPAFSSSDEGETFLSSLADFKK